MEDDTLNEVLNSYKKPKHFREETIKNIREGLKFTRQDIMGFTLEQVTVLTTRLLEDKEVIELANQGEYITLGEIAARNPRKTRSDKGVPRKKVVDSEELPDGYLVDADGNDMEPVKFEGYEDPQDEAVA